MRLLPFLLLSACTPLVGQWEGTLQCGDVEEDIRFDLDWDEDHYAGDGLLQYSGNAGGGDATITVYFDVEVDPLSFLGGDQELDVDADSTTCEYTLGSGSFEFECAGSELDEGNEFRWEGGVIEVDGNCEGELERDG